MQVPKHPSSRRTALRRSLPVEQNWISQRHHNQSSFLQGLHTFRRNRHLRFFFVYLHRLDSSHQNLRGRLSGHHRKIHALERKPRGAILPQHGHPPVRWRPDLELRLLPNSHSPSRRPSAGLMGRAHGQHGPVQLLRYLSDKHLHHPDSYYTLTALHHHFLCSRNVQRRRKHHVRRNDPSHRLH